MPMKLTTYRHAPGALLMGKGQTLPHLACSTTTQARRFTCAIVRDGKAADRHIAAANAARPMPLTYTFLRGQQRVRPFVDTSSLKAGVPTANKGYSLFSAPGSVLSGRMPADSPLVLLQYGSHRQREVTHFSFMAEVYAMLEGVRAAKELAVTLALVKSRKQVQAGARRHIHGQTFDLPYA